MSCGAGVEQHGVGHWKKLQAEQDLGHRSDVDLKDKWRNIVKSVKANKQMRGVVLSPDDIARVQVRTPRPVIVALLVVVEDACDNAQHRGACLHVCNAFVGLRWIEVSLVSFSFKCVWHWQECLRIFEASKEQPHIGGDSGHHVITHIPHMEGMGGEQVDPGHALDPNQLAPAPPLEQTYQHDAMAHHQAMVCSASAAQPQLRFRPVHRVRPQLVLVLSSHWLVHTAAAGRV